MERSRRSRRLKERFSPTKIGLGDVLTSKTHRTGRPCWGISAPASFTALYPKTSFIFTFSFVFRSKMVHTPLQRCNPASEEMAFSRQVSRFTVGGAYHATVHSYTKYTQRMLSGFKRLSYQIYKCPLKQNIYIMRNIFRYANKTLLQFIS